jgi:hypothetical protein
MVIGIAPNIKKKEIKKKEHHFLSYKVAQSLDPPTDLFHDCHSELASNAHTL